MLRVEKLKSQHPYAANTYLISSGGEYAIIDPTVPPDQIGNCDAKERLKYIFLTHSHFDHITEVASWKEATDAIVYISRHEINGPADPFFNCNRVFFGKDDGYFGEISPMAEGDEFRLGDERLTVIELPGHTKGCIALISESCAFVGDTVFAGGGYGRWDLPSGDFVSLQASIERVMGLEASLVLYCGHGPETTVMEYTANYRNKHR